MRTAIKNININQVMKFVCLFIILIMITSVAAHAQISDPGSGGSGGSTDPDGAPIDGGLSLLIAAGVGYGMKKIKHKMNG